MARTYYADLSRDDEAGVWYVLDTDVPGLVAEAASEQDLVNKIRALVPELHALNRHLFDQSVRDVIPLRMTSRRLETIHLTG